MLDLQVQIERARGRETATGDILVRSRDARQRHILHAVAVFFHEGKAEHAQRLRIGGNLLHNQIVVLAAFDIGAIFAHLLADLLVGVLVALFQGLHRRFAVAALEHVQLVETVARAAGRRRADHLNADIGQRRVYIFPGARPIGALAERIGSQRQIDIAFGERGEIGFARLGDDQAINTDLQFDQALHTVLGAILDFALLDAARCVGGIGELRAKPGTHQLDAAAGAGRFDDRRRKFRPLALELFSDSGGEGIDGGGANDADLRAAAARTASKPDRQKGSQAETKGGRHADWWQEIHPHGAHGRAIRRPVPLPRLIGLYDRRMWAI